MRLRQLLVKKELGKTHKQCLTTDAAKFYKAALKKVRLDKRIDKITKGIEVMEGEGLKYPSGTGAFKFTTDYDAGEVGWSKCIQGDKVLSLSIGMGLSRVDAMHKIHHMCTKWMQGIELVILEEAYVSINVEASKTAFMEACAEVADPDDVDEEQVDLGIGFPLIVKPQAPRCSIARIP